MRVHKPVVCVLVCGFFAAAMFVNHVLRLRLNVNCSVPSGGYGCDEVSGKGRFSNKYGNVMGLLGVFTETGCVARCIKGFRLDDQPDFDLDLSLQKSLLIMIYNGSY